MRRFLVVGCGGSGGATLAYMMDQLRSELSGFGVQKLPRGWQFVYIDVPGAIEEGPEGLPNVQRQGGTYFGSGPQDGKYAVLDSAVSGSLKQLDGIATWAPRDPNDVTSPISVGAGQYRAVGRMITLKSAQQIQGRLAAAVNELSRVETHQEMRALAGAIPGTHQYQDNEPLVVLVVSSMSGGAGASMALDVCRMLTLVPNAPGLIGVFMIGADVFDRLPPDAKAGVRSNSLAMFGEIVSTQAGVAKWHDQSLLEKLGIQAAYGAELPFSRVFPVGHFMGTDRTPFGDGNPPPVYRGLARGLAALMTSDTATREFVSYDLGNERGLSASQKLFGWGISNWGPMPWGAFGYACLSTGRQRYREYAAQRIARGCVDRLIEGHLQPHSTASAIEQANQLLDSQWGDVCARIGLPVTPRDMPVWLTNQAFPRIDDEARGILANDLAPHLPPPGNAQAAQWIDVLRMRVAERRADLTNACSYAAYRRAFRWHQQLSGATLATVADAVSRFGIPYSVALLQRLEAHLADLLIPGARHFAQQGARDLGVLPESAEANLRVLRGVIANGQQVVAAVTDSFLDPLRAQTYAHICLLVEQVVPAFVAEFVTPLRANLLEALRFIEMARDPNHASPGDVGIARLETDQYLAWPYDGEESVKARFLHATNEVLLMKASEFDAQYQLDLAGSLPRPDHPGGLPPQASARADFDTARRSVWTQVISGIWPTTGGVQPPGNLLEQTAPWRTRVFTRDPQTNEMVPPMAPAFDLHARPTEVLARARSYVSRPGESFQRFVGVSLRDMLSAGNATDAQAATTQNEIVAAFTEALSYARPLIGVNKDAVARIHNGSTVQYRYKFSDIPFRGLAVSPRLSSVLSNNQAIDPLTRETFEKALRGSESQATRIDIFGSYANYSPIVFDSVLSLAASEWSSTTQDEGRTVFWKWRRSRTLPASLPMSDAERRAMVSGWLVGQVVGLIKLPAPPYDRHTGPVEIWDPQAASWRAFPHPMLTPPHEFLAPYDWLPAVLESSLLAIAFAPTQQFESLRPYTLLRSIYDDDEVGPTNAGPMTQLAAERHLITWLRTGRSASGLPTRVPGLTELSTPEEREKAAVDWLGRLGELAGREYMSAADGGIGGGRFATITQRSEAARTPLFRDVAPDVYAAVADLRNLLRQAATKASAPDQPGPTPFEDRPPSSDFVF